MFANKLSGLLKLILSGVLKLGVCAYVHEVKLFSLVLPPSLIFSSQNKYSVMPCYSFIHSTGTLFNFLTVLSSDNRAYLRVYSK